MSGLKGNGAPKGHLSPQGAQKRNDLLRAVTIDCRRLIALWPSESWFRDQFPGFTAALDHANGIDYKLIRPMIKARETSDDGFNWFHVQRSERAESDQGLDCRPGRCSPDCQNPGCADSR